ncbi:MAG: hypothetical protein AAB759_02930 [Patescibacteria group bacterium]
MRQIFRRLPAAIRTAIDIRELCVAPEAMRALRSELERKLGHYVVTYRRAVFRKDIPAKGHLCAHLKGARLSKKQQAILREYEAEAIPRGVSFVVYQKPLKTMRPSASAVYRYLHQRRGR